MFDLSANEDKFYKYPNPCIMACSEGLFYSYKPLDTSTESLRLCRLLPGQLEDPIHCELYTCTSGHEDNSYEALSYAWGDGPDSCPIRIDSREHVIRPSLWAALQAIRSTVECRTIWCDALCINQQDIRERNHQVARMYGIYSRARKVLVWLGPAADNSDLVFECIHFMPHRYNNSKRTYAPREKVIRAFKNLSLRSYWRRAWIRQEILSARDIDILCGFQKASWGRFWFKIQVGLGPTNPMECIRRFRENEEVGDVVKYDDGVEFVYPSFPNLRYNLYVRTSDESNLPPRRTFEVSLRALALADHCECSDIRDRVFSILALGSDTQPIAAELIDYGADAYALYFGLLLRYNARNAQRFASDLRRTLELSFLAIITTWNGMTRPYLSTTECDTASAGEVLASQLQVEARHSLEWIFGHPLLEFAPHPVCPACTIHAAHCLKFDLMFRYCQGRIISTGRLVRESVEGGSAEPWSG